MTSNMEREHIDNIVRPPPPFIRQSRRSSLLNFSTPSRHRRVGTLKFEELDHTQPRHGLDKEAVLTRELSYDSLTSTRTVKLFSNIGLFWTSSIVGLPILGFTAALLALVFVYRVSNDTSHLFGTLQSLPTDHSSILVNFPATRLVFIASWSSTLAPMLLGSLMALWHIPTACKLATITNQDDVRQFPTPHQLSMLVGLSTGSFDELRKYIMYRLNSVKANQPRILTRSALVMVISSVLSALIFGADTAIHTFTSTTPYSKVSIETTPGFGFGRGLINVCVGFDRSTNQGLPCTVIADASVGANVNARDSGEIIALEHNVSSRNAIWTVQDQRLENGDLLVLMPQTTEIPPNVDYQATTVGVSTQCLPSTGQCHVRMSGGVTSADSFVMFNCTNNFRGVLGASPNISSDTVLWVHTDSTTPDFNVKSDRNFQYACFSDPTLDEIYNSIGGTVSNGGASGQLALPDDRLLNPIYLATAGLVPVQTGPTGKSLASDEDMFSVGGAFVAYTLNCSVTSYDVSYTWINGTIKYFDYTATRNGSILELSHGMQAVGIPSLSQAQSVASLSSTAAGLARSFANSHSADSLTLIGSVMSPRTNMAEATRKDMLITKMSTAAFGFLVGSNLLYVVFGLVLLVRAWRHNSPDARDMVARLSVEGLSAMAFEDTVEKRVRRVDDVKDMFEESRIGDSSRKVGLKAFPGGGHVMFVEQPRL
ncbi:hypothetical protein LTR47_000316 [Exophiala xenobiotica]|nr:hypothetical protein LTR47_000316 [Exophiala xenobiotica]KAK5246214.1 hypothetical protein LTS06_008449 [Exophiala xenobiotica]KAK5349702.1 hypothetical protein LTR61_006408 [Exophiala xenobiotica]KAK5387380.1 hypothetical protein LTR11_001045 [Exophiala xenobiotica]KAK5388740.1 hypothetical protein LTS03_001161 [Exophiala xenobiotica]